MNERKHLINKWTVIFIMLLLTVSAIGYLFAPEQMLSVVGIQGTTENNFLVKTIAAALLSFTPPLFAITRQTSETNLRWYIVLGLALYMFLSSAIDFYGYLTEVVNFASIPSIAFRVILGILLLVTNKKSS